MLVTVDDVMTYMDFRTFSNQQRDSCQVVLDGLQSEMEAILRRPAEPTVFAERYYVPSDFLVGTSQSAFNNPLMDMSGFMSPSAALSGSTYGSADITYRPTYKLHLRQSPVTAITSIVVTGATIGSPPLALVAGQQYTSLRWGVEIFDIFPNDQIDITYTAGLDGATVRMFKLMILRAASREMTWQVDDTLGIHDLQPKRALIKVEIGFTDAEIKKIKMHKRKQV